MSGESAANTLWTVGKNRALSQINDPTENDMRLAEEKFKKPVLDQYEKESNPYYATARLWDDGILDPSQTRQVLALAFATTLNAPLSTDRFGTFRM